ncbi:MAG: hypothetical protein ACSW8C_05105 [bacterium]
MRFYFKKESLKRRLTPIYWRELSSFFEEQSQNTSDPDYAYVVCGEDGKSCLFYENLSEKSLFPCDIYVALDPHLRIPKEDFYLSSVLPDEVTDGWNQVCLLPVGSSLNGRENAEEIWIITEEDVSAIRNLSQREVCSIAQIHGKMKVFTRQAFERLGSDILKELVHCKKLISITNDKVLNHWLRILFGEDFILYSDDVSSPIRYAVMHLTHPFLKEQSRSKYDEACLYQYGVWTSALRRLSIQLCSRENSEHISWSPQEALMYLAEQCLAPKHENPGTLFRHLKACCYFVPFALPKWRENKSSLPALMDFVEKHPENEDMQQLLATYLLNFLPQECWYRAEQFFAPQERFLGVLHKTMDVLEKQYNITCSINFAYGTYIRAIRDQQKYTCGWGQSLATCFDFALNQNFKKIIEFAKPYIEKKSLSGVGLAKLLLTPLLVLRKNISKAFVGVCRELIALENTNDENIYGESIFYRALLYLLEGDEAALKSFLNQNFDPIKTRGYLGILGLFLLKYDARYADLGKRLLLLEKMELLAKKPLALQLKAWGMLTIGNREAYETCAKLLLKEKNYFTQSNSFTEKWFLQAKIEEILGHKDRAKRFRFLHNNMGMHPCIWEMFE